MGIARRSISCGLFLPPFEVRLALDEPPLPLRRRAGSGRWAVLGFARHDDEVRAGALGPCLDLLEHLRRDAEALHDLAAQLATTAAVAKERVHRVDDDVLVVVEEDHAALAATVLHEELHADWLAESVLAVVQHGSVFGKDLVQQELHLVGALVDGGVRRVALVEPEWPGLGRFDRVGVGGRCGEVGHF